MIFLMKTQIKKIYQKNQNFDLNRDLN